MKRQFFKGLMIILVVVFMLSAGSKQVYSRVVFNQVEAFFDDPDRQVIRSLCIEAAGYFLKGFSDVLSLSDRIEMSDLRGLDYGDALLLADRAVFNLENAGEKYQLLHQIGAGVSLDPVLMIQLRDFDFEGFAESFGLKGNSYKRAEVYLKRGNLRGMFQRAVSDIEVILRLLRSNSQSLKYQAIPEMSDIWELNRLCSEFLLFGQCAARIFYRVTGK